MNAARPLRERPDSRGIGCQKCGDRLILTGDVTTIYRLLHLAVEGEGVGPPNEIQGDTDLTQIGGRVLIHGLHDLDGVLVRWWNGSALPSRPSPEPFRYGEVVADWLQGRPV